MSLLGDLWGGVPASLEGSETSAKERKGKTAEGISGTRPGYTYAQAACSSSSGELTTAGQRRNEPRMDKKVVVGAKRPRSPREGACGRCFRSSHSTADCRHQVVCLRCSGVGHVAARCPVDDRRSPRRRKVHVRSKLSGGKGGVPERERVDGRLPEKVSRTQERGEGGMTEGERTRLKVNCASLSLSISPESYELREELAKVAVLSLVGGNVNEGSVLEILPSILNTKMAGPAVPLNENSFLLPFENRDVVREVVKLGSFDAMTRDGKCRLNLAHWTAELGTSGRADGEGQWISIWNLPLHGWCWRIIEQVLRPVGDLITLSKASEPHKKFVKALVRRRRGVVLPMELDFSFGMRRYFILFTEERGVLPEFCRTSGRYVLWETIRNGGVLATERPLPQREVMEEKGKSTMAPVAGEGLRGDERRKGITMERSGEGGSKTGVPVRRGGITILQRRAEDKNEKGSLPSLQSPSVERSSHGEDLGSTPLVELSSRGEGSRLNLHGGPPEGGPRRPTVVARTVGLCTLASGARVSELEDEMRHDAVKGRSSRDERVAWRVKRPVAGAADRAVTLGKQRVVEVVAVDADDDEVVADEVDALTQSEVDAGVEDLMLEQVKDYEAVKASQLVGSDWRLGLSPTVASSGPGERLMGLDPIAEEVGHDLGLIQEDGLDEVKFGSGDPLLLCEVDRSMGGPIHSSGTLVSRERDLQSRGRHPLTGENSLMGGGLEVFDIPSNIDFGDVTVQPEVVPPTGFIWKLSEGVWALFPVSLRGDKCERPSVPDLQEGHGDSLSADKLTSEGDEDSDDSVSEFARNLRELLPGLQVSSSAGGKEPPVGSRRSERQKKPSSRFNAEAGFIPEPPRSTKKKTVQEGVTEDGAKARLDDTMATVRRSLEFLESKNQRDRGDSTAEEAPDRSIE
ncbi:uncharacterized protein LOC120275526 [Dioscorea cayenensis subsp. rotundata]|uniref:Uncharacterized protein LOC120275526 n=1 Tax=Dioscorea cayennensis subsp. rotundata TaxID=55577 RepID=A0AB40CDU2_DIOCR|nr:uncharacterized protein LOC120275526 [Dioscorea cayenensis subsp. rotundata]